ncbi:MAG: hypothetical protein NWF04_02910 [Candidatus Bathyarchaeota archaeon]|nr:hypothetical protein [Candidatus Bathyarchaeota archaeon]
MDYTNYPFLKKFIGDFEKDHPLVKRFELVPTYKGHIERLLQESEGLQNIQHKINRIKNKRDNNWESYIVELEFARKIKSLKPEFIREENGKAGKATPDLKTCLLGKNVYFEVGLIKTPVDIGRLMGEIGRIKSDLRVQITFDDSLELNEYQEDKLLEEIKAKIGAGITGCFPAAGYEIKIYKNRLDGTTESTPLSFCQLKSNVVSEQIRRKIRSVFDKKNKQFKAYSPVFCVIDCEKWEYDITDYKRALYGNSIAARKTIFELYTDSGLENLSINPDKTGIFYENEAKYLSGVIIMYCGNTYLLPNPNTEYPLDHNSMKHLLHALQLN